MHILSYSFLFEKIKDVTSIPKGAIFCGILDQSFCHLVNDTGCAMGRLLISILDNYQQPGGVVKVPEALQRVVKKEQLEPAGGK